MRSSSISYLCAVGCLLVLAASVSCDRSTAPDPVPIPDCRLVKRYDPAGIMATEVYTYDRQNRLVEASHERRGAVFSVRRFEYNDDNRVAMESFAAGPGDPVTQTITYYYNEKKQMRGWLVMENGRRTEVTRELDAEGNCVTLTSVATDVSSGATVTRRHAYQYENGNLVGSISDVGMEAERRWAYAYFPDRENTLRAHEAVAGNFLGKGPSPARSLLKTVRGTGEGSSAADAQTRHYAYEFNPEGFPTRITATGTDAGPATVQVIEYDCR